LLFWRSKMLLLTKYKNESCYFWKEHVI
jgi:hypothetical protein